MDLLDADPSRSAFLHTLKHALDPGGVLAPGRYLSVETR